MIKELMTPFPATITPSDSIQHAAQLMDDLNVGALPVCQGKRVVGLITDRDITVRATAVGLNPLLTPVHSVMSSPVRTGYVHQQVCELLELMASKQIRRIPLINSEQELVGILSLGDLAERFEGDTSHALRNISTPARPDRLTVRRTDRRIGDRSKRNTSIAESEADVDG